MATQSQLVMRTGPNPGKTFTLNKPEMYIGRDISNDIVINDAEVSRKHVRLVLQGTEYVVEDLGSTNGTFINGQRIAGPHLLSSGETLQMGENVSLVFESTSYDPDATAVMTPREAATLDAEPMEEAPVMAESEPEPMMAPMMDPEPMPEPEPEPMAAEPAYMPPAPSATMAEPMMAPPAPEPSSTFTGQPAPMSSAPPMAAEAPPKKSNRGLMIGCGCLLLLVVCSAVGWAAWTYGDALMRTLGF